MIAVHEILQEQVLLSGPATVIFISGFIVLLILSIFSFVGVGLFISIWYTRLVNFFDGKRTVEVVKHRKGKHA